jgi:predicted mannosyl-3-phosphoglycerate phosphatase (HAD superfamily)
MEEDDSIDVDNDQEWKPTEHFHLKCACRALRSRVDEIKAAVESSPYSEQVKGEIETGLFGIDVDALSEEESDEESTTSTDWRQPEAVFPGSGSEEVTAFLHGEKKTETFSHFSGKDHAINWANKYFGDDRDRKECVGYSANADAGFNSSGAYVKVTKTRVDGSEDKTKAGKIKT